VLESGLMPRFLLAISMAGCLFLAPPLARHALAQAASATAETVARTVVSQLAAERFADVEALFGPQMQAALPEEKLRAAWASIESTAGAFKAIESVRGDAKGIYRIAIVTTAFERAPIDIQIVIDGDGKVAGLSMRPASSPSAYLAPSYARPGAYTETSVTVGAPDWPLPGTLTMPVGDASVPAVILVHGSGPQDRDATFGPNRIFQDLALGLASRGIAVVRYEKRSKALAGRLNALGPITVKDEVVDDVVAAVAFLKKAPRIDPARIFVVGHSLGGMLVPRIARADGTIRGLVALAGAVRSLEQSIVEQTRYLIVADGQLTPDEQQQLQSVEQLAGTVRALTAADAASRTSIGGAPPSYWLDLRGYDPSSAAASLSQPLLILQGERDYQVTMTDFDKWRVALKAKPNATLKSYGALNHLFMAGTGPSLPSEYLAPGHVAEEVVTDIAAWITTLK
jgi:dienelactone hydrolase